MEQKSEKLKQILTDLRGQGSRITSLRQSLITILVSSPRPVSVAEITAALKKRKLAPNKSSIYRELNFLMERKLILELDVLEGLKRYEWQGEDSHHHHHIVCTECGIVECVEICFNDGDISHKVEKKSGFVVTSHLLEFFGTCPSCR